MLPVHLLEFFQIETENSVLKRKTIMDFVAQPTYANKKILMPSILVQICDLLVSHGYLNPLHKGGALGIENSYIVTAPGVLSNYSGSMLEDFKDQISCLTFGFPFIFEQYKKSILPICHIKANGDKTVGTGFLYKEYLITAKHCVEEAKAISLQGLSKMDLVSSTFNCHGNKDIDLAFIKMPKTLPLAKPFTRLESENILDTVITMGYPSVPGFHTIQTVEQAQVSSRLTVTRGSVAGVGTQYFSNSELILITAKIRGGNSGGPVVNANGAVIGVAIQTPLGEGNYDDLGYGTVLPSELIDEMINSPSPIKDKIQFDDFE